MSSARPFQYWYDQLDVAHRSVSQQVLPSLSFHRRETEKKQDTASNMKVVLLRNNSRRNVDVGEIQLGRQTYY